MYGQNFGTVRDGEKVLNSIDPWRREKRRCSGRLGLATERLETAIRVYVGKNE